MSEELKQAAQAALEQLEFLNACYPHKTATDASDALRRALAQRPAAQTEREDFEAWLRTKPEARLWNTTDAMLAAYQAGRASLPTQQAAQAARIWINHDLRDVSVHQQDEPGWVEFEVQTGGIAAQATPEPECARSHPHENMSATCELRTEIARLRNENTRLKAATPKPFAAPGRWFPVDVLGNPMREFEPGKWEVALWPSATPEPVGEVAGHFAQDKYGVWHMLPPGSTSGTKLYTRPARGVPEDVQRNAARWEEVLRQVGADRQCGGFRFTLYNLRPIPGSSPMQGAVCQHFTQAVDAALAAAQAKGGAK